MSFSVSLPNILAAIEDTWDNAIQRSQFVTKADSAKTVKMKQTANIQPLIEGTGRDAKSRTVQIYWQNAAAVVLSSRTDECVAASHELTDSSGNYTLDQTAEASFVTSWKAARTKPHNIATTIATGLLKSLKLLDEKLNLDLLTALAANNGTHEYTLNTGAANGSDVWEIPQVDWTDDLIPEFLNAAEFAYMNNAIMLHGLNLWKEQYKAGQYAANADGKGENNMYQDLEMYWDRIGFAAASLSTESFLLNADAVALATGNYWSPVPVLFAGNHRMYSLPSRTIPGVSYDVHELETCSSDDFVLSYKIVANYGVFINPKSLTTTRTGILQFSRIAGV